MNIRLAVVQCALSDDAAENNQKMLSYLEQASRAQAQVVLVPELFLNHYFCKVQDDRFFTLALKVEQNIYLAAMQKACKQLNVAVPFSFFEKDGPNYFNSVAMIDADGQILGVYRKSHIPDGPGYCEKFYFRPGDTGFRVFNTKFARLGLGICWDQWFPECARIMTLQGAEILLYPSAIGSEPKAPDLDTKKPWRRVMKGHAVANIIPVAAANRTGIEGDQCFYGSSFASDHLGEYLLNMDDQEGLGLCDVDIKKADSLRASFGFFRDRRTDLYKKLLD